MSPSDVTDLTAGLRSSLGLSQYEVLAYLALVRNGELSPGRLSQVSGVPRPRAYDVLRTLAERGFATERPGRPVRFAPTDPRYAVNSRLSALEEAMKSDLESRRNASERIAHSLAKIFDEFHSAVGDQSVAVGSTTNTMWRQLEMLKNRTSKEYVSTTVNPSVPPYGVFAADLAMLDRGVKFRLIRPFPSSMGKRYREWYSRLTEAGAEVRTSTGLEFAYDVSDGANLVLWLNESSARSPTEAIWLRHSHVAGLLKRDFDELWQRANPISV